ncbi:SDR family oxidoreductase [Caulobacter endophyticus]|uniref:SDR family oxidoreductase n=1 Tax=Caulobacter endophyticus TaxID=2172652 RepID=UPI00240F4FC0|nr:SDR family oxidoreductase [Caulobacter endophyticus]MDG2530684.1 SDR family oxidoreductase [Caulobacter endophyticus]
MTTTFKTALVTGASGGIGAATARRLAQDGFAVVVHYGGRAQPAQALAAEIEAAGGRAVAMQADVADPAAVTAMFATAQAVFGGIDVVVANAGVLELAPIAETDDALFDRTIAINLKGAFNVLREAARQVRPGGRIVSVSTSVVGLLLPTYGAYAASKAAVEALTQILARELRGREITANVIAPGPTATPLFLEGKSPELVERLAKAAPLERLGRPEDIAAAIAFLAGPDGAWVNGQVLRANGGIV